MKGTQITNNSFTFVTTFALLGSAAMPAYAIPPSTGGDAYVDSISLSAGAPNTVELKNTATSKFADDADIKVTTTTLQIPLTGSVKCIKDKKVNYDKGRAYFGPAVVSGDTVSAPQALHNANYEPSWTVWDGIGNGQWNTESGNDDTYDVPLASIKNGHPAVRFDPMEEFNKKLQAHIQGGGKKFEFLRNDHEYTVSRTVSMGAWCKKDSTSRAQVATAQVNLKLKYKGDKNLTGDHVQVNAQMQNNPNQIGQNPNLPFMLNDVQFQPNMPNYTGKCIPDKDPVIRMNFTISGGKQGLVDLRVAAISNTYGAYGNYFETSEIAKNPKTGGGYLDFSFPLKAILSQDKYSYMAIADSKTYTHNMRIEARYKNYEDGTWSEWKQYDTAVFKHRCTPSVAVSTGGQIGGFDNGDDKGGDKKLKLAPNQGGDPSPSLQIKAPEPKPANPGNVKAPEQQQKGLLLPAVQKVRE